MDHPSPTDIIPHDLPRLAPRPRDGHKGTFGRVLAVGGSLGMSGAIGLTGLAALRSGAGLVSVACPISILSIVASFEPCYTTIPLLDLNGLINPQAILGLVNLPATALAIGPGMGTNLELGKSLAQLLKRDKRPMVIDSDGLNNLVANLAFVRERGAPTIITPHPGEFARLTGEKTIESDRRIELARAFSEHHRVVTVLKGHQTVITDGNVHFINQTGNPGMATGGSGDVLTGIIAALLAQGMEPLAAARLGVWVHGRAGDLAATAFGEVSMIARDLISFLPRAFQELELPPEAS